MPNTSSAKKALRQSNRRALINKIRKTKIKNVIKKVLIAIKLGNKLEAQKKFRDAQPVLHKSVHTNILHRNNVARKLSKLSGKIKSMPGEFIIGKIAA